MGRPEPDHHAARRGRRPLGGLDLLADNLAALRAGQPLRNVVPLTGGATGPAPAGGSSGRATRSGHSRAARSTADPVDDPDDPSPSSHSRSPIRPALSTHGSSPRTAPPSTGRPPSKARHRLQAARRTRARFGRARPAQGRRVTRSAARVDARWPRRM